MAQKTTHGHRFLFTHFLFAHGGTLSRALLVGGLGMALVACQASPDKIAGSESGDSNQTEVSRPDLQTLCEDPRPEICTYEYKPVCGWLERGEWKTFSNGCHACSELATVGFIEGECD